MTLAIFK